MKDYQIVVRRIGNKNWFTPQYRNVRFLFSGSWHDIHPAHLATLEEAEELLGYYIEAQYRQTSSKFKGALES